MGCLWQVKGNGLPAILFVPEGVFLLLKMLACHLCEEQCAYPVVLEVVILCGKAIHNLNLVKAYCFCKFHRYGLTYSRPVFFCLAPGGLKVTVQNIDGGIQIFAVKLGLHKLAGSDDRLDCSLLCLGHEPVAVTLLGRREDRTAQNECHTE